MSHLLLLEDLTDSRRSLEQHLKREGFTLHAFVQGKEAQRFLTQSASGHAARLDAAILDLSTAALEPLETLRTIRSDKHLKHLPVVLLTTRAEEIDRVLALNLGADDYISRPFSSRELVARLRALLRRATFMDKGEKPMQITFGPLAVDLEKHVAHQNGEPLDLTRREFELLAFFIQNPRKVLSREKILQLVWGLEYLGESRTIDAHVRRIRAKLGEEGPLIETVVGVGYRLGPVLG